MHSDVLKEQLSPVQAVDRFRRNAKDKNSAAIGAKVDAQIELLLGMADTFDNNLGQIAAQNRFDGVHGIRFCIANGRRSTHFRTRFQAALEQVDANYLSSTQIPDC